MAISDTQKTDYLFKKLGFGITKTDTNSNKSAANESIASPLLLRGDKVWQQASSIPGTKPSSSATPVTVYTGATTVECTADITASTNRTWKTGLTDWIPPEFGSTYLVNVYVHTSSDASNAESISNKLFITGSGNDDEWFFDYQSGVLHFIGDNLPNGVDFSGKSIYISGARYTGAFGVGSAGGEDANLGNLTISNVTITSSTESDNIILDAESGLVVIEGNSGIVIPSGTTAQREATPPTGTLRYNTSTGYVEVYDGSYYEIVGTNSVALTSQSFTPDGVANSFTLNNTATTNTVFVNINGVVQHPGAYSVSGNVLTLTETPRTEDIIEVRHLSESVSVSALTNGSGNAYVETNEDGSIDLVASGAVEVNGVEVGYKNIPQVASGNVTLALTDSGKHYYSTTSATETITIPDNANVAFAKGTAIMIVNKGTGNVAVARASGVALYLAGNSTSANRTVSTYGMATLIKTDDNEWFISGTGVS